MVMSVITLANHFGGLFDSKFTLKLRVTMVESVHHHHVPQLWGHVCIKGDPEPQDYHGEHLWGLVTHFHLILQKICEKESQSLSNTQKSTKVLLYI